MLYSFFRVITRIALKIFFKSFHVRNADLVPQNSPLIIAANHPSTLMDALVLGVSIKQPLYFMAKGNLFTTRFRRWLFKHLHMIPIYRRMDNPELMKENEKIFRQCYHLLARGGALLIFPEGTSIADRKLQRIKTGTARIALGAESKNGFGLDSWIVPVGINYSEIGIFRSEVFINFAKGIRVSDYEDIFKENEHLAVHQLTEEIRLRLEKHIIAIEDQSLKDLVHDLEAIYKRELRQRADSGLKPHEADFLLTKGIVNAVDYFQKNKPELFDLIRSKIQTYMRNLRRLRLRDDFLRSGHLRKSFSIDSVKSVAFAILTFPLYLFGLFNNFLPYKLPGVLARRLTDSIEYQGPIKLVLGMIFFPLFYGVQIWLVFIVSENLFLSILYATSLPPSGFFTLFYWYRSEIILTNLMLISLFYRRNLLISNLIMQRREIMKMLERAREDYLAATTDVEQD